MEDDLLWCDDAMICAKCGNAWIAVHPCRELLECPSCGFFNKSEWAADRDEWLEYLDDDDIGNKF